MYGYKARGVCSVQINFDVDEKTDTLKSVQFIGGCPGNTQAVCKLVQGKKVNEVIEALEGIRCRGNTSCPDQLAQALKTYKKEKENKK